MSSKSVLIIMESLQGGGAEKVLADLLRNWNHERYPLTLLVLHAFGPYVEQIAPRGEMLSLSTRPASKVERALEHCLPLRKAMLRRQLRGVLGDRRFDIMISWMEGPAMRAHSLLLDRADRHISWVHTNLKLNPWSNYFFGSVESEAKAYSRMDNVIAVSRGAMEAFSERFGRTEGVDFIYNLIDREAIIARADEETVPHDRFTLVSVGRLGKEKRHDRLLEMADILRKRGLDPEIWILGVGKLESQLREQAGTLGLEDHVRFLGFRPNPYPYVKAADLMVMSSDTEGYPLVVAESLCIGTPVVSTNITGPDELLKDGGGILTPLDAGALADAVGRLMNDADSLSRLAAEAYEIGKRFDPKAVVRRIERLLDGE